MASLVNWLYIDLNSYFASVEQHLNPAYRGRALAVVPMLVDSTCVIAASHEAKKFGIKAGTLVGDAKRMCPGLILVSGNHSAYVKYHHQIVKAVESCHPVGAILSIDEVACRLRGRDQSVPNAMALAYEIKNKIYNQIGKCFSCSIGLAPNQFLAKTATDMQKPNGLVVIEMTDLPHKLFSLKLRDLVGIGKQMEARLNAHGVYTVAELYKTPLKKLCSIWGGVGGEYFYKWLRGEDFLISHKENQSIGHQHVLPPQQRSAKWAYMVGLRLLNKAAVRLRKLNLWAQHLAVIVKLANHQYAKGAIKMIECQDTFALQNAFDQIWSNLNVGTPIKISVTLSHLLHDTERTLSFFENTKKQSLSHLMDNLNELYGKNTVHMGSVHEVLDSAPLRIAFSNIPKADI